MSEKTLFISDLDGTLLNSSCRLSQRTIEMLNLFLSKGVLFTYATARSWHSANRLCKDLNLTLPVITFNGVFIVNPKTGEPYIKNILEPSLIKSIRGYLNELDESPLVYSIQDGKERVSYLKGKENSGIKKYLEDRKGDPRFRPCDSIEDLYDGEVFYVTLINPKSPRETLDSFFSYSNGFSVNYQPDTYYDNYYWYEIFNKNASKASALKQLKEIIHADKVISFGDNYNDIPMFLVSDECYAVKNALDDLKRYAKGIIESNDHSGVCLFIERRITEQWEYTKQPLYKQPDPIRFENALKNVTSSNKDGIGTLNEKLIHQVLKSYYSEKPDQEARISGFIADAVNENGIFEIQTANFQKLKPKLSRILDCCHVTIVYPFEKKIHSQIVHPDTGEILKTSKPYTQYSLTKFFFELYRIKEFLSNPNLTICLAELEIRKEFYQTSIEQHRLKKKSYKKTPVRLLKEMYLQEMKDYAIFLPDGLPELFTTKEFIKYSKHCDDTILLKILEYLCIVEKIGKDGKKFIYQVVK